MPGRRIHRMAVALGVYSLAFVMALILCPLASATSVVAPGATETVLDGTNNDAVASVAVTEAKATGGGDVLGAYKIMDAELDISSGPVYGFTTLFKDFQKSSYALIGSYDLSEMTVTEYEALSSESTQMAILVEQVERYVRANGIVANHTATADANGVATFAGVAMGQYIVVGQGAPQSARVYTPATIEVVPTTAATDSGSYVIGNAYTASMSTANTPDATMTVTDGTAVEASAAIGGNTSFTLTATVPTYPANASNTTAVMRDTLPMGLTYEGNLKITNDSEETLVPGTDYTFFQSGRNLYIMLNYAGSTKVRLAKKITATYEAALNSDAAIGTATGNPNSYGFVYAGNPLNGSTWIPGSDSSSTPSNVTATAERKTTVYTYAMAIRKTSERSGARLANATFDVSDANGTRIASVVTDADGIASVVGLGEGTYTLAETKPPAGHNKAADTTLVIDRGSGAFARVTTATTTSYTTDRTAAAIQTQAVDESGTPLWLVAGDVSASATASATQPEGQVAAYVANTVAQIDDVAGGTAATGYVAADIVDTAGLQLPDIGGMRMMFLALAAILLVAAVAIALITRRRVKHRER